MDFNGGLNVSMPEQPINHLIKEHGSRFERIESKIAKLEEFMNQNLPLIGQMKADLYNDGKEGLKTRFLNFIADDEATKRTQREMHLANIQKFDSFSKKLGWIIALLALLCSILGVIIAAKGLAKASQMITNPFHSDIPVEVLSETYNPQF